MKVSLSLMSCYITKEKVSQTIETGLKIMKDLSRKLSRQPAETKGVFAKLMAIRKQNKELKCEMEVLCSQLLKRVKYLNDSVNRLTIVPERVTTNFNCYVTNNNSIPNDDCTSDAQSRPATLCKNPKSLYTL